MNKIINWMGGWPKEGLVSASDWEERLAAAAERAHRDGKNDADGEFSRGDLKSLLSLGLLKAKTQGHADRLRLASGADALLVRLAAKSLNPGDIVLVERLTSRSALQVFRKSGIRTEAVEGDGRGPDPSALRAAITQFRPRLLYAAPACTDPEGAAWAEERVREVTEICRETGVLFLRDDRQEMLAYADEAGGESVPHGVLSIGQLPPGLVAELRFGWAAGKREELGKWFPPETRDANLAEPGVTPLERSALCGLIRDQPLEPLVDMLRVQCGERMRRFTQLLRQHPRSGLRWKEPSGGIHIWLRLPDGLDGEVLLRGAWIKGLMFQPGAPFFADRPERNAMRVTFAFSDERETKAGVSRLLDAMGDFLGRSSDYGS